jgi:death-on-curing protein
LVDGNKRTAHAAMETFLVLNGLEIVAAVDEQEQMILMLADSQLGREDLTGWLQQKVRPI